MYIGCLAQPETLDLESYIYSILYYSFFVDLPIVFSGHIGFATSANGLEFNQDMLFFPERLLPFEVLTAKDASTKLGCFG